jgi:hypothetical protein
MPIIRWFIITHNDFIEHYSDYNPMQTTCCCSLKISAEEPCRSNEQIISRREIAQALHINPNYANGFFEH